MPAQFLRHHNGISPLPHNLLQNLQQAVAVACQNQHPAFFRTANRVITFQFDNKTYRIDVDQANDQAARQQMNLQPGQEMLYAQLQTGSRTFANIVYPAQSGMVQLNTLIVALQQSMAGRAIFTAIH